MEYLLERFKNVNLLFNIMMPIKYFDNQDVYRSEPKDS